MEVFNEKIIPEYVEWKNANKKSFSWWSFVNMKSDIQVALGFAKFFYPEIIIKDGCFLLKDNFDERRYQGWSKECKGDKQQIESMMNLYDVDDFFENNTDFNNPYIDEQIDALANVIKLFWTMSFKARYPDKNIIVDIFDYYDATSVTVYEKK